MNIKDVYNVSLCKGGVLGGMMYVKDTELLYCTNKLTVSPKLRRLHMQFSDIEGIENAAFSTVIISMKNGESYRFLVFSRKSLRRRVNKKMTESR